MPGPFSNMGMEVGLEKEWQEASFNFIKTIIKIEEETSGTLQVADGEQTGPIPNFHSFL